jgi:toxin CcdB
MARLDVYPLPNGAEGYVVDVQADLLSYLATRTVIPLLPLAKAKLAMSDLNPIFQINGNSFVLVTQEIAALPKHRFRHAVASLNAAHDKIIRALDILLSGF